MRKIHEFEDYNIKSKSMTDIKALYVNEPVIPLKVSRSSSYDYNGAVRLKNDFEKFRSCNSSSRRTSCSETISECDSSDEEESDAEAKRENKIQNNNYLRVTDTHNRRGSLPNEFLPSITEPVNDSEDNSIENNKITLSVHKEQQRLVRYKLLNTHNRRRTIGCEQEIKNDLKSMQIR